MSDVQERFEHYRVCISDPWHREMLWLLGSFERYLVPVRNGEIQEKAWKESEIKFIAYCLDAKGEPRAPGPDSFRARIDAQAEKELDIRIFCGPTGPLLYTWKGVKGMMS